MTTVEDPLKPIPTGEYPLFLRAFKEKMEATGWSLERTRKFFAQNLKKRHAYEHVGFLNAAYVELKKQEQSDNKV